MIIKPPERAERLQKSMRIHRVTEVCVSAALTSYHEAENCHDMHVLFSTSPSFTPQAHNFHHHGVSPHHSAQTEQAAATVLKHARSHSAGLPLAAVHFPSYTLTLHQSILLQSCVQSSQIYGSCDCPNRAFIIF